jgi:hypothetical protein
VRNKSEDRGWKREDGIAGYLRWSIFYPLFSILVLLAGGAKAQTTQPADVKKAIARGVEFLVKDQSPDGSWGTGLQTRGFEVLSMVPGSLDAYRVGTSALCVMALQEAGEKTAHDKGLEYLINVPEAKRDDGELIYNTWAHIFSLQAFAEEMLAGNRDPRLKKAAEASIKRLEKYATYMGGWNYYDFHAETVQPSMGPTSFGTAAGLVALHEAKQAGVEVPKRLIELSVHRLEECRLPTGYFLYGSDYKYVPRMPGNMARGAIGRTQPSNYALWLWESPKVNQPGIRAGLDGFFKEHDFIDMGRKRPIPHESWYQTAGYYYYYDHYYLARLLEALPASDRGVYLKQLVPAIVPHQEGDGSWWDFAMWDFHKPYGTAFAVMTLLRCQ